MITRKPLRRKECGKCAWAELDAIIIGDRLTRCSNPKGIHYHDGFCPRSTNCPQWVDKDNPGEVPFQ